MCFLQKIITFLHLFSDYILFLKRYKYTEYLIFVIFMKYFIKIFLKVSMFYISYKIREETT